MSALRSLSAALLAYLIGTVLILPDSGRQAHAADESPAVQAFVFTAAEDIASAYGLLIVPEVADPAKTTITRRHASAERAEDRSWRIKVELTADDAAHPRAFLTAVAVTASGKALAGEVRALHGVSRTVRASNIRCGPSSRYQHLEKLLALDEKALTELIAVRKQRAQLLAEAVKKELTEPVLKRLSELEAQAGLRADPPLGPQSAPEELARRLGAIRALSGK